MEKNKKIAAPPAGRRAGADRRAPRRLAAVDVGTNSIRCIVVEADGKGGYRILDDEKSTVRLGEGLLETGAIGPAGWERAREALVRIRKVLDGLGVGGYAAVATSAVRTAVNGREFLRVMKRETGISIRPIAHQEEAELAALSARRQFDMSGRRYAVIDIGGGSVEIVTASGDISEDVYSLDLGAVFLTEKFLRRDPIPRKDFARMRRYVRKRIRSAVSSESIPQVVGSGGTMTTIGHTVMASRGESFDSVHGYEVLHSDVVHLLATLRHRSLKERRSLSGLSPERADIIVAGVAVVDRIMRHFGANLLRISEGGIREGLLLKVLQDHGLAEPRQQRRDWRSSVESFARSCHVDEIHARQVTDLALRLFDALTRRFDLGDRSREILEAAALLHDTGYLISYPKHHKHSYHLIRHAGLYGFTPREREIIANVARYHRRALPKKKHEGFSALALEDRRTVRRLGGILRLADGLDRRRSRQVRELRCSHRNGRFYLRLGGSGDLAPEIHWGGVKGDLLERAFGVSLSLRAL